MDCNCFERIIGIRNSERISYRGIVDKTKAIKDKLVQLRYRNPGPSLESVLLACKGLMYKLFGDKTELINKPNMDHNCTTFEKHRQTLKSLFAKANKPSRGPIIIPSSPQFVTQRCTTPIPMDDADTDSCPDLHELSPSQPTWTSQSPMIDPPMTPPGSPNQTIGLDNTKPTNSQELAIVPYTQPKTQTNELSTCPLELEPEMEHEKEEDCQTNQSNSFR